MSPLYAAGDTVDVPMRNNERGRITELIVNGRQECVYRVTFESPFEPIGYFMAQDLIPVIVNGKEVCP